MIYKYPKKLQMYMTNKPKTPNEQIKTHFKIHLSSHPSSKKMQNIKIPKFPRESKPHWLDTLLLLFFFKIIHSSNI